MNNPTTKHELDNLKNRVPINLVDMQLINYVTT